MTGAPARTFFVEFNKALCNEAIEPPKYDLSDIWDRKIDKENGLAYYRKLFENGVPVCEMPIKGKRPEIHPVSDSIITDKYDASELKKPEDTAKKLDITKFELFFSAISMVLGKYTSSEEVVIGVPTNMRPSDANNVEITGDSLAYMIYTSGSTGVPKGVMLKHEGICNYLRPHPANIHMKSVHDLVNTYLSITTVSFDMSFREHTASLCNGKTLVFSSDSDMNDPRALARLMEKYNVDCINATPSRLQQYLYNAAFCERLKYCKCIMAGGELYPISLRDKIKEIAPNARLLNTYGPTEITVSCNVGDLTSAEYVTVGRPLLNYKEYIVDKFGDIAPFGVADELYVGGIVVGKGYRNPEKKTAELFVTYNGERMYRTGDLAKWDNEGRVLIIGRLDSQIKLRGLRIELGEIENVIGSFDGIKEAAVAVKTINNTEHIAAYFTADKQIDIEKRQ